MVQYDWEVLSLYTASEENGLGDVVKRATWRYQAKDGSYVADVYKDTYFDLPDPEKYQHYNNLNPDVVVGWIEEKIDIDELKAELNTKLDEIKNPARVVEKTRPWDYVNFYLLEDKYVMFHQGEFLVGPMHWNSDYFNSKLKSVGLEPSFPGDIHVRQRKILPVFEPLVVDADTDTILYKCEILNDQPEDSIFDKNDYLVWDLTAWPVTGTYDVVTKPINEIKDNIKRYLTNKRAEKDIAGTTVTVNDQEVKVLTGPLSRLLMVEKLTTMGEEDTTLWKFMDDVWVTLTKQDVQSLLQQVDQYVEELNEWEYSKTLEINNASTVDQLRDIEI